MLYVVMYVGGTRSRQYLEQPGPLLGMGNFDFTFLKHVLHKYHHPA